MLTLCIEVNQTHYIVLDKAASVWYTTHVMGDSRLLRGLHEIAEYFRLRAASDPKYRGASTVLRWFHKLGLPLVRVEYPLPGGGFTRAWTISTRAADIWLSLQSPVFRKRPRGLSRPAPSRADRVLKRILEG